MNESSATRRATFAVSHAAVKSKSAAEHNSPTLRVWHNISLLIHALSFACATIAALFIVEWLARSIASVGWFPPAFCWAGLLGCGFWIAWDFRRHVRRAMRGRAACTLIRGRDAL